MWPKWFPRKSNEEPTLRIALRLIQEAQTKLENVGYVLADTTDWERVEEKSHKKQASECFTKAAFQLSVTHDEVLLALRSIRKKKK